MKRAFPVLLALCLYAACSHAGAEELSLSFQRFGSVTVYRNTATPSNVVLFVSGDGGWNKGVVDMARILTELDALVVGIDIIHYLKALEGSEEKCSYPAADFEALSKFVQKKLGFPRYVAPLLVGYSSGATLVYATLVQAPPNTFRGAMSLGFCPDLPLTRPFCRGNGLAWKPGPKGKGYSFLPAEKLDALWIAFQGTIDEVCDPSATEEYVKQVKDAQVIVLPKVGHGFSVPRNWLPQFRDGFNRIVARKAQDASSQSDALQDLPLVEVPAQQSSGDALAVILSGDGGWAGIDREVGNILAARGIPVVGLNSLQYFWQARTPKGASKDLERILEHYLSAWHKQQAILIGYSLGADVLPLMANRLPPETLSRVQLIALLGPGTDADFEFHLSDWLGRSSTKDSRPILPEVEKLRGKKIICFYGEAETDTLCKEIKPELATALPLPGAHHFGGNYGAIADAILQQAGESR